MNEPHGRLQHQLERLLERVRRDVGAGARGRASGVPDDDVEPTEGLDRFRDGTLQVLRQRYVTADGERA